jgi:hypothetical protein
MLFEAAKRKLSEGELSKVGYDAFRNAILEVNIVKVQTIDEYFKANIGVVFDKDMPERAKGNVELIKSSLKLPSDITESVGKQVEAFIKEFKINIKTSDVNWMKNMTNVILAFEVYVKDGGEVKFLQKIDLISMLIKWHGYGDIGKVSQEELGKLEGIYGGLGCKNLSEVTQGIFNKISLINFNELKAVPKLTLLEINKLLEFTHYYGINVSLDHSLLNRVVFLKEIFKELGIEKGWLLDENQKKLEILFEGNNIYKLADIEASTVSGVSKITREFQIHFTKISELKLTGILGVLKALDINFGTRAEVIEVKVSFIKQFCRIEELNSHNIVGIAKINDILGIEKRDKRGVKEISEYIKASGIKLSIERDLGDELNKIKKISGIFEALSGRAIKDLKGSEIKNIAVFLETFVVKDIFFVKSEEIEGLRSFLTLLATKVESIDAKRAKGLKNLMTSLDLDISQELPVTNLINNLKRLRVDIWDIDFWDIKKIDEVLGKFHGKILEVVEDAKIERILKIIDKFNYESLGKVSLQELGKLDELSKILGKEGVGVLSLEEINKLILIVEKLKIDVLSASIADIKLVSAVMVGFDLPSATRPKEIFAFYGAGLGLAR